MYKILGSDGNEYGPLSAEKIKQWILEGRLEKKTPILPDGAEDWVFLSSLPEFEAAFASPQKLETAGSRQKAAVADGGLYRAAFAGCDRRWSSFLF